MPHDVVRYPRYRFPPAIISHAVWLYYRFTLSFRDVEDLLAHRGITISYESIRHWWHLDELFVTIRGQRQYLWRAVDQDGDVIDILLQPRRDRHAAARFFSQIAQAERPCPAPLASGATVPPTGSLCRPLSTTPLATPTTGSKFPTSRRAAASAHMRRFKSVAHAQRFLAVHDVVRNLFTIGRHRLRAGHQRLLRSRAFGTWKAVAAA